MLVLVRRVGETIHIGSEIVVQLMALRIGRLRISIRAPRHVAIDRPEVRAARLAAPASTTAPAPAGATGLLVLARRPGERLLIGDDIVVTILGTRGLGAIFGIDAPPNVTIDRGEIYERKRAEQHLFMDPTPRDAPLETEDDSPTSARTTLRRRRVAVPTE